MPDGVRRSDFAVRKRAPAESPAETKALGKGARKFHPMTKKQGKTTCFLQRPDRKNKMMVSRKRESLHLSYVSVERKFTLSSLRWNLLEQVAPD